MIDNNPTINDLNRKISDLMSKIERINNGLYRVPSRVRLAKLSVLRNELTLLVKMKNEILAIVKEHMV